MTGRKPIPLKVVSDNKRVHRSKDELEARKEREPKISSSVLRCPAHLSDASKKEWRRIVRLYRQLSEQLMTDLDTNALEIYCVALETYRKAMAKVRETSEVYASKTDPNKPRKNPWLTVANDAATQIKKYGEILLLDPVSRARVGLAKAKIEELSPMELYFKRKQERSNDT
jgi:P27 family predicted phage terminase small subunit